MDIKLSRRETENLSDALLDAYRSYNNLKRMVRFELDINLETEVGRGKLKDVVFDLIDWADETGKLQHLIIGAHAQNPGNPVLKEFYATVFKRQFILSPVSVPSAIGPEIAWKGFTEEVELQSFFRPQPDWYDVGFLKRAIAQSASVCRIEIPSRNTQGTGVLIAPQLVLTNYHVFQSDEGDRPLVNPEDVWLYFGCVTDEDGTETKEKPLQLDRDNPIVGSSSTDRLDYVLLKVDNIIRHHDLIKPAKLGLQTSLSPRMGIHLLHHPAGDSMKLSISLDGITHVDRHTGRVQYINKAVGGSSGSPCFDENWQLVALHHAERSKSFGSIREGILFSSIYPEIQPFLLKCL